MAGAFGQGHEGPVKSYRPAQDPLAVVHYTFGANGCGCPVAVLGPGTQEPETDNASCLNASYPPRLGMAHRDAPKPSKDPEETPAAPMTYPSGRKHNRKFQLSQSLVPRCAPDLLRLACGFFCGLQTHLTDPNKELNIGYHASYSR